jgi:UDP-glucose 4-epimerase
VFASHHFDAVIHFAAKKAVGESMTIPLDYFDVNVGGTINLLRVMRTHKSTRSCSSSRSIYGDQYSRPISEADQPAPVNLTPVRSSSASRYQVRLRSRLRSQRHLLAVFHPAGAH